MASGEKGKAPKESKVMIGLEIHFQLKGKKLFCDCSTESYGVQKTSFERILSPTASEMGFYDPAAEYEKTRDRKFRYVSTDNSCLVEADEEPPHSPNEDAIATGMMVAGSLNCRPLDSVMFMRKVVVDGSNTSGFQRTAVVGFDGKMETSRGPVRISSVCVEEDSARKIEQDRKVEEDVLYSLDRLGIPLLEIATEPDILDAEHAVEVAKSIGFIVASTGRSRRQVDSIRQDVNISLGFGRVEIKGIQKLSLIGKSISHEIERQRNMRDAMEILKKRGGMKRPIMFSEAGKYFEKTESKMLKNAFRNRLSIYASVGSNLDGLLKNDQFRVGKDLSDIAKAFGLGGILHTDELPAFGITGKEVEMAREELSPGDEDAIIFVIADKSKAGKLSDAFTSRIKKLSSLDFSETRGPLEDGSTKFLRPLPGKDRMYPETDVPIVQIGSDARQRISEFVPRSEEEIAKDLSEEFSISLQDARTIASNFLLDDFRDLTETTKDGKLSARIMLQTIPEMEKKHKASFETGELNRLLKISTEMGWSRNTLENAMEVMLTRKLDAKQSAKEVQEASLSEGDLMVLVKEIADASGKEIKPGTLIAMLKQKTKKSFDPKEAIEILEKLK